MGDQTNMSPAIATAPYHYGWKINALKN